MPTTANAAQWSETNARSASTASPLYAVYDPLLDFWGWSELSPADGAIVYDPVVGFHSVNEFEIAGRQALLVNGYVIVLPVDPDVPSLFRYVPGFSVELITFARATTANQTSSLGILVPKAIDVLRDAHYIGGFPHLLLEPVRTNVVLHNRDLTNAAWVKTDCLAAKDQNAADDVPNAASRLQATDAGATCLQSITLASSQRKQSAYVRRLSGTGVIDMTTNGGTTWTPIVPTAVWQPFELAAATLANPSVGFRFASGGDQIAVDFVQNENGASRTSPIATTTAAVARAADVLSSWGVTWASQLGTQYNRWVDLETQAYVDEITYSTGTAPSLPVTNRAYTHVVVFAGTLTEEVVHELIGF